MSGVSIASRETMGAENGRLAWRGALGAGFVGAGRAVILQAGVRWPLHEAFALAHEAVGAKVMKWLGALVVRLYGVEKNAGSGFAKFVAGGLAFPVFKLHELLFRLAFRLGEFRYALLGVQYGHLSLDEALVYLAHGFKDSGLGVQVGKGADNLGGGLNGAEGGLNFAKHGLDGGALVAVGKAEGRAL